MISQKVTGIVLAGGKSSRMGSNKSLLRLNGRTMIEYSIEALKPLCNEVIISSDDTVYTFTGCPVWPDEIKSQAPIAGIYSCLHRSENEVNIIVTCDMPLVTTQVLEHLLAHSDGSDITVPVHEDGRIEPLCGIYKKTAAGMLKMCIDKGNLSMHRSIMKANHRLVTTGNHLPFFSPDHFRNINTPADFEFISSLLLPGNNL